MFKKSKRALTIGNILIDSAPFFALVNPADRPNFKRHAFLKEFTHTAYSCGVAKSKELNHISYWYDGAYPNIGVKLWEGGYIHQAQNSVIGISRLYFADTKTIEIAKEIVHTLLQNQNIVLLLPTEDETEEISNFYKNVFPDALLVEVP